MTARPAPPRELPDELDTLSRVIEDQIAALAPASDGRPEFIELNFLPSILPPGTLAPQTWPDWIAHRISEDRVRLVYASATIDDGPPCWIAGLLLAQSWRGARADRLRRDEEPARLTLLRARAWLSAGLAGAGRGLEHEPLPFGADELSAPVAAISLAIAEGAAVLVPDPGRPGWQTLRVIASVESLT